MLLYTYHVFIFNTFMKLGLEIGLFVLALLETINVYDYLVLEFYYEGLMGKGANMSSALHYTLSFDPRIHYAAVILFFTFSRLIYNVMLTNFRFMLKEQCYSCGYLVYDVVNCLICHSC